MQGVELMDRELLDAGSLVGHLVPAGSMFEFLSVHRRELFPDEDFDDLFGSGRGRPSIPASVMASILVLQTLHDLSDRETAEAARCDLRWKVATGMAVDDAGFDASTLVYWRRRLARSERPHRINDAVKDVIEQTGVLKGRRRRAVDSTILADAVATQDTITQLVSAMRRVRRLVPGAAEQIERVCSGHDYSRPGKPRIDWDDPEAKDAMVSALVNDANALLAALTDPELGEELDEEAQAALALLALVAGQDVEPAEGSDGTDGRWRIARRVAPGRVVSTVDPEARHTRKSPENRRDGYRAHVSADPETGIITDEKLTQAAGADNSDAAVAAEFVAAEAEACEWYGDSAYGSGDLRATINDQNQPADQPADGQQPDEQQPDAGVGADPADVAPVEPADGPAGAGDVPASRAVIKPRPLRVPVAGGFSVDDFTVSADGTAVSCPAGHTRPVRGKLRTASFGRLCRACPLRARCTRSKTGRNIVLSKHDDLLRQARRDWADHPELRDKYRTFRPNVERVISQVASRGGRRIKLRYRGTIKNHAWLSRRTAVLNLRNLIGRGLDSVAGTWQLSPGTA